MILILKKCTILLTYIILFRKFIKKDRALAELFDYIEILIVVCLNTLLFQFAGKPFLTFPFSSAAGFPFTDDGLIE